MTKVSYDDFERILNNSDLTGQMSEWDMQLARDNPEAGLGIFYAKQDYQNATNDQQRSTANRNAENIRSQYGQYTAGNSGNGRTPIPKYEISQDPYADKYGSQIDDMLDRITNRDEFNYDPQADPAYQSYRAMYRREGDRAAQNALGNAAAMTGGQLNSYALTASQQASDYYNAQMSDRIPELQQLAYQMYQDNVANDRRDLDTYRALEQDNYGRYLDDRNQWNQNRNYGYQNNRDDINDLRYQDETAYNRQQDAMNWNYAKDSDSYNRAMQKWATLGYLDADSAKVLGLPTGTKTSSYDYQLAQLAQTTKPSGGGPSTGKKSVGRAKSRDGSGGNGTNNGGIDYKIDDDDEDNHIQPQKTMLGTSLSAGGQQVLNSVLSAKTTIGKESALMAGVSAELVKDAAEAVQIAKIAGIRLINLPISK